MKIALIGATGYVGSQLLVEARARGHHVTALARNPKDVPYHDRVRAVEADVSHTSNLAASLAHHDVVVSAFNPGDDPDGGGDRAILQAVRQAQVPRFLAVGGASSLLLPDGRRLVDQPDFPAQWKPGALLTAAFLDHLRAERRLDWVILSPSAMLAPGKRTARYRVGRDDLLLDADGNSHISLEDFAVAMLEEAESPQHHRQRFTVGY
ncbi:MAG: NAD(P)-dependent oxidoreductase [Alphaproteobacteria bacterium]|nr:MAG: NAD(P)-dependent oxidoreductase [Alphaproteobacteria bacterium]